MNPKTKALRNKASNNKLLNKFFKGGQTAVGSGRYTVALGKSKTGPCKICRARAGTHNIASTTGKRPPHHPNCKCHITK